MKNILLLLIAIIIGTQAFSATKYAIQSANAPVGNTGFCYGAPVSGAYTDKWILCTGTSTGTSGATITYQWLIDGYAVAGASGTFIASPAAVTTCTLSALPALDTLHVGTHHLYVRYSWTSSPTGCASPVYSDTLAINIIPLPVISATPGSVNYCPGSAGITLTASGGSGYLWQPSAGLSSPTGATVVAAPSAAVTYTVTGYGGGCAGTALAQVNFPAPFSVSAIAMPSVICTGGTSVLSATVTNSNYNTVTPIPYTAYTPSAPVTVDFSVDPNDGWSNVTIPFSFYMYGTAYNTVNINANGFINFGTSDTAVWNSFTLPDASAPSQMIALFLHDLDLTFFGAVTYETIGTIPNRQFIISYNNVPDADYTSTNNTGRIILYESGNTIDLVIDACNEPGDASGDFTTTTGVQNVNGTAGIAVSGLNGTYFTVADTAWRITGLASADYNYSWSASASGSATAIVNASGTYSVSVTSVATGCTIKTNATVGTAALPTIAALTVSDTSLCTGGILTLTASGVAGSDDRVYNWSGPGLAATTGSVATFSATAVATGTYSVFVTYYGSGCTSDTAVAPSVTVSAQPSVALWATPTFVCAGHTMTISATPSGGAGTAAYTWSGPAITGFAGPFASPNYVFPTDAVTPAGSYSVQLTYSGTGCNTAFASSVIINTANEQWAGTYSSDWNTAANWTCGTVPLATDDVVIPGGMSFAPVIGPGTSFAGDLILAGTTLQLYAGAQLTVAGNLHNDGAITGDGIIYMNSANTQSLTGNGAVSNLTLANTNGVAIGTSGDTVGITGTLLLNAGTFTTNDRLMLLSSASGSGSIGAITGGSIAGNVTVDQYIPGGRRAYRFWAHPFSAAIPLKQITPYIDITGSGGATNGFTTTVSNAPSAYWYNPQYGNSTIGFDPGWRAFTNTSAVTDSNQLHQYEGMRLYIRGAKSEGLSGGTYIVDPVTIRMQGSVNTGNISIPMAKGTGDYADYNLIGNPYPSITDIGTVIANAAADSLVAGAAFWVWDPYIGTSGQFVTVAIGSPYYMGANESFEVRTTANGNALSFAETNKATAVSSILLRSAENKYITLSISDTAMRLYDKLLLRFDATASESEDNKDGRKPQSAASLNFSSISSDNKQLSLDARPYRSGHSIPLSLTSNYAQDFIIKATGLSALTDGPLYLHDKFMGQYTLLTEGATYHFAITGDSLSQGASRFELRMGEADTTILAATLKVSLTPNPATDEVTINYNNNEPENTAITLINTAGQVVIVRQLGRQQSGSTKISLSTLPAGIYTVTIQVGNNKTTQRLVKE